MISNSKITGAESKVLIGAILTFNQKLPVEKCFLSLSDDHVEKLMLLIDTAYHLPLEDIGIRNYLSFQAANKFREKYADHIIDALLGRDDFRIQVLKQEIEMLVAFIADFISLSRTHSKIKPPTLRMSVDLVSIRCALKQCLSV